MHQSSIMSILPILLVPFVMAQTASFRSENATAATEYALQYGFSLTAWAQLSVPLIAFAGVNTLFANTNLANASQTEVVFPNADTLYSTAAFDLTRDDLTVTVPEVDPGRYWSVSVYDPFGSNFAVFGSIEGSSAGDYTLSWKPPQNRSSSAVAGNSINSPVAYGIILIRILVKDNGTDLTHVRQLIESCTLTEVGIPEPHEGVPPLSLLTFANLSSTDAPDAILELTARTQKACPPFGMNDTASVIAELMVAGIYDGLYHMVSGVDVAAAADKALATIDAFPETGFKSLSGNWETTTVQGLYGANFVARAYIADTAYLALVDTQVIYPLYTEGNFSLSDGEAYLYTFSSKPPLGTTGWWSLTMYNETGYLVDNPINVFSVGDRSNSTYPDGSPVYGFNSTSDESFEILVQPATVPPPSNWAQNWLPSPEHGEMFSVSLRFYSPTAAITDGSWLYPVVSKVPAITA
ncbi:hypothetical protein K402DRAFT_349836 [Aulographum hederae CBS 113979]|uniref:DUF1254-domain-containing protein n=1 Tax=Aulographum hederae CBS 113979 TaxID=1176131 RepID=A0A6G1H960_9PEZI|nr:hypothetical protein K402DRAFT_349836 [Aulographum hederae CBS 113979]